MADQATKCGEQQRYKMIGSYHQEWFMCGHRPCAAVQCSVANCKHRPICQHANFTCAEDDVETALFKASDYAANGPPAEPVVGKQQWKILRWHLNNALKSCLKLHKSSDVCEEKRPPYTHILEMLETHCMFAAQDKRTTFMISGTIQTVCYHPTMDLIHLALAGWPASASARWIKMAACYKNNSAFHFSHTHSTVQLLSLVIHWFWFCSCLYSERASTTMVFLEASTLIFWLVVTDVFTSSDLRGKWNAA